MWLWMCQIALWVHHNIDAHMATFAVLCELYKLTNLQIGLYFTLQLTVAIAFQLTTELTNKRCHRST